MSLRLWMTGICASVLGLASLAAQAQTVRYIHTDALGSPVAVTNANRTVIERSEYEPYGQVVNRPVKAGPGYTGHVMDASTGLAYMQQRYYDPMIGRFLSLDPIAVDTTTAWNFNRYSYAANNPYKFTDPDGREISYRYQGGVTEAQGRLHMLSMMWSSTARKELTQLEESSWNYEIVIDDRAVAENGYDEINRRIFVNPNRELKIKSSGETQSPRINSFHEVTHAAEHDRVGDENFKTANVKPKTPEGVGVSPEEERATEMEKQVGREVGEPTRQHYRDVER